MPWSAVDEIDDLNYTHVGDATDAKPQTFVEPAFSEDRPLDEKAALSGVLDELQEIGAIDPSAQQQLMADLKETKPEHYALVVDQFRTALAYRQQLAEREMKKAQHSSPEEMIAHGSRSRQASRRRSDEATAPNGVPAMQIASSAARENFESRAASRTTKSLHLPPPPSSVASAIDNQVQVVTHVEAGLPTANSNASWEEQLKSSIAKLEASVAPSPRTVDEVHEHLRLRTLQLLAGNQEAALQPIPGASPAQQDYWAKQLYAISTFLDQKSHKDSKSRAAAALVHLDAARGQLAELATLQVRNMTFASRVDGFGEYKTVEKARFKPGGQVTLYAEVANYRSDSTEEGYRTLLTTSYQIVDKAGQRVDGGQFPDIEDLCQNRRRDFHMQYTIPLPMRIYAGTYEMQLIITDGLSNKIGQASVPFEIE
ncbi:MAG: hypothetical protein RH917_07685 [Lacipirellulaceae bacterium]